MVVIGAGVILAVVGLAFAVGFALAPAGLLETGGNEAGLSAEEAAEAPVGGGELLEEDVLEGTGGLLFGFEGGEEFEEGLLVLFVQNRVGGEEAMLEGVAGAGRLALWGFGPGAELGVAAVGVELALRRHGDAAP